MRKHHLLISTFLCLALGTIQAKPILPESYFTVCSLTVTASISGSGGSTICLGSSVNLNATPANGTSPYTYSWSPAMGLNNSHIANPVATPTVSTSYTVTVTDYAGCTATASVGITVNQPPVINADTLLLQYLSNQPLTAIGGVPPYTYTFSPAISSSELIHMPDIPITFTINVTGANGCGQSYFANYIPLIGGSTGACTTIFMSEYIQDTVNNSSYATGEDDAIELYNPTANPINLSSYYLEGTTNGSLYATPFFIALHGTIAAHKTFLIANTYADTALRNKANMLSDSLTFRGKDIVALSHIVISSPNITFSFLDELGTISPLPTDSGWAVGTGSTKNHTLVRHSSVTQGDLNWTSCKTEWTVDPRGTYTHIGHYNNICTPTDPDVGFSFSNPVTICGEPSYTTFAVIAASNPSTVFNNCVIDINYSGEEFAGNSLSNGGIIVTRGPNFQPGYGNDYDVFDSADVSDSVMKITLGSVSDSSPNGTYLPVIGDTLFLISLRVQNSCKPATIQFTDLFNTDTAYYVNVDSIPYLYPDTTETIICYDCIHDSCDYDTGCSCYLSYCSYDSVAYVYGDTTLYNYGYPNSHYTNIDYIGSGRSTLSGCAIYIDQLPGVNAGTNGKSDPANSSILTLTGYGFGNIQGQFQVYDANSFLTNVNLDNTDILSWTENKIVIKMPSYIINTEPIITTPGSGQFQLINYCHENCYGSLWINYNIENVLYPLGKKTRPNIVMSTGSASLVFRCDTSISNNPQAYACVKKAVREWNCYTGVNWQVGPDIILDTTLIDGISTIYFGNNNYFLSAAALMVTTQEVYGCRDSVDSVAFYNEADIKIKRGQYLPIGKFWSYDTTYRSSSPDSFYFYDDMLHELGHALGLGHINDPASLMYWYNPSGRRDSITGCSNYPGPQTLYGAFDMINTSIAYNPASLPDHCSDNILVTDTRGCIDHELSVPDILKNPYNLNLYPNPISYGDITITYELTQNSRVQFKIFDCTGRVIMNLNNENKPPGIYSEQLNTDALAEGVYLFTANINGEIKIIKFVKL